MYDVIRAELLRWHCLATRRSGEIGNDALDLVDIAPAAVGVESIGQLVDPVWLVSNDDLHPSENLRGSYPDANQTPRRPQSTLYDQSLL